jgi:hypothetical protein
MLRSISVMPNVVRNLISKLRRQKYKNAWKICFRHYVEDEVSLDLYKFRSFYFKQEMFGNSICQETVVYFSDKEHYVGFEDITDVVRKVFIFWNIKPCSIKIRI